MIEILTDLPETPEMLERVLTAAAEAALAYEGAAGDITISVVDDEEIHRMNREYRGVDRPTDVSEFPGGGRGCISGHPGCISGGYRYFASAR